MTEVRDPVWIDNSALLLLHGESLTMFGGSEGLRDESLLDSALAWLGLCSYWLMAILRQTSQHWSQPAPAGLPTIIHSSMATSGPRSCRLA